MKNYDSQHKANREINKERLKDKIYGLCEECWDDYMDWSWFEMLAGNDFSTKRYENIN
jgi:hypothetical protein